MNTIANNLKTVKEKINNACRVSGRKESSVTLIAVSKTKPIEYLKAAYDCGIRDFGENKVQEILDKIDKMPPDTRFHMIGHLQKNKVKYIVGKVFLIHSVDSYELAEVISKESVKRNVTTDILIEVNVSGEATKYGCSVNEAESLVRRISLLPNIKVKGFMTIAPYVEDGSENRQYFACLKQLSIDINLQNIDNISTDIISMGMTVDYEAAVIEGATYVRVGTAIFGERNYT